MPSLDHLSPLAYQVTQESATEPPFSGAYWNHWKNGYYYCICCHNALFKSDQKFDAGCGWPSFNQPIDSTKMSEHSDHTYGMHRTEVRCAQCNAHLGHVFKDGPQPTGLRYCINSVSLTFEATK